jgi:3-oxoacyl-[acyl-carrier protein] reductase
VVLSARDPEGVRRAADQAGATGVAADLADPQTPAARRGRPRGVRRVDGALVSVGGPPAGSALG